MIPARRGERRQHPLAHIEPTTDTPRAGFYKRRLVKGGPWVAVLIWHGRPPDPVTGELLDRSPRWQAMLGGDRVPVDLVWPYCAGDPIDAAEYAWIEDTRRWAERHDLSAPEAAARSPIDWRSLPPPTWE